MNDAKKSCGTCKHWARDQDPPSCHWPAPPMPFWALFGNGDHGDYTEAKDGRRCPAWVESVLSAITK